MINEDLLNWQNLLIGVQFLLGVQLIVIALIHFIYPANLSRIPLAFLCLILGLWFFKCVFYAYWNSSLLLFILIGPGKPIFAGSVLLFYYKSSSGELKTSYVLSHLLVPTIYYLFLIMFRHFRPDAFPSLDNSQIPFFSICVLLIFWYYFFLTSKELKTKVKQKLIPKAYKKVMFLFYSLYFFLLQVPIWDIYSRLIKARVLPDSIQTQLEFLYYNFFKYAGEYMSYSYLHVLGYFLFLYALSDLTFFKQLFLPKETLINQNTLSQKHDIDDLMYQYFAKDKLYKNPGLTLDSCAKEINLPKRDLMDYFKLTNKGLFKDFVNSLRIEEFKTLLENEEFEHYDLVGLAKECGFKSKSTFFRVFKNMEGVTPNEFRKEVFLKVRK